MGLIDIDINDTKRKAGQIRDLATDTKKVANSDMTTIESTLPGAWKGEAAKRYDKKIRRMESRIRDNGKDLDNIASGLSAAVGRFEAAENFAKSLFGF